MPTLAAYPVLVLKYLRNIPKFEITETRKVNPTLNDNNTSTPGGYKDLPRLCIYRRFTNVVRARTPSDYPLHREFGAGCFVEDQDNDNGRQAMRDWVGAAGSAHRGGEKV